TIFACQSQSQEGAASSESQNDVSYQDVSVTEFKNLMEGENVIVLDVRTPPETAKGKIEGAMELDYRSPDFSEKVGELDKEKTYLIYCRSGGRSSNACKIMAKEGFKKLYNLEGGYTAWSK
ncbi:MAG: rhodanese-like domain-containing protein, partial [Bacteroidota bacterium]